jgi:hypothetical protein
MGTTPLLALLCTCILSTGHAADVAVSIRCPKGKSDGELVRQLTEPTDS